MSRHRGWELHLRMSVLDWLNKFLRWGLAGVFIYAGSTKLLEPKTFTALIEAYGIVPESLIMHISVALPILELAAGIGLLFDIGGSLAVITGLLGLFIVILIYGIWVGLDVDCGCFGPEDPAGETFHGLRQSLYRDIGMLAGIIFMYSWRRYRAIKPVRIQLFKGKFITRRSEDAHV